MIEYDLQYKVQQHQPGSLGPIPAVYWVFVSADRGFSDPLATARHQRATLPKALL